MMHTLPSVWGLAVPGDGVKDGLEGGEQRLEEHSGGCHKTQGETEEHEKGKYRISRRSPEKGPLGLGIDKSFPIAGK